MALIHLINPNTSAATTDMMTALAREAAPAGMTVEGLTARRGVSLIVEPAALAVAGEAVMELASTLTGDGVIVAAFGDPGADALAAALPIPVIGIGEAAIRAAAQSNRRFSIVTTTPGLEASIRDRVIALGFGAQLASIRISTTDPHALTADAAALETTLRSLAERCISDDGAAAIIVGGGPLSRAARAISTQISVPLVEPVPSAVTHIAGLLARRSAR